jgi:hypothetical protein
MARKIYSHNGSPTVISDSVPLILTQNQYKISKKDEHFFKFKRGSYEGEIEILQDTIEIDVRRTGGYTALIIITTIFIAFFTIIGIALAWYTLSHKTNEEIKSLTKQISGSSGCRIFLIERLVQLNERIEYLTNELDHHYGWSQAKRDSVLRKLDKYIAERDLYEGRVESPSVHVPSGSPALPQQDAYCTGCGALLAPGDIYCTECGKRRGT